MTEYLQLLLEAIEDPADPALERSVQGRLDSLTKPPGSLGRLEEIARWYCLARGEALPAAPRKALCVFCADHGVTEEGVSAYPREVTRQMVLNFAAGGAAINALCRQGGVEATIVDVGVDSEPFGPPVRDEKIARGTRNFAVEPAMTRGEALQALEAGARLAAEAVDAGATLLAAGEMGIGNTTAAAALGCALTGRAADELAGRGTGVDEAGRRHKAAVVERALAARKPDSADPVGALAAVGGLEIAAMAGYFLGAAARRVPAVVDGFIATAAALAAVRLRKETLGYLLWSHESAEQGHRVLLQELGAKSLLQMGFRLGEGSGAAVAMGLVDQALAVYREMATFDSAGVSAG
ncbi:MAG: nicotinate-nucleotide--dimethylbenzimidazole phosphoribosyltransferase [Acidobacteria bacterium]|nr:nicotinate-nucleotide--dimethylbenzimidazole phosphoribosyltransferase [Acidobacteriota bacterium]